MKIKNRKEQKDMHILEFVFILAAVAVPIAMVLDMLLDLDARIIYITLFSVVLVLVLVVAAYCDGGCEYQDMAVERKVLVRQIEHGEKIDRNGDLYEEIVKFNEKLHAVRDKTDNSFNWHTCEESTELECIKLDGDLCEDTQNRDDFEGEEHTKK